MEHLFTVLNHAVAGSPVIALAAALAWGLLSVLLSPCHLSSIPLIVGFVDQQGSVSTRRALLISFLFALGRFVAIAIIGLLTAQAGSMLGHVGRYGNYLVAAMLFILGLVLMDVIPLPFSGPGQVNFRRKGPLAAFVIGLILGIALGPCTFAFLAPMLVVGFKASTHNAAYGVALLLTFAAGHCAVIVAAGTSTALVQKYLNWNEKSRGAILLKRICGGLVLAGGLYLVYIA